MAGKDRIADILLHAGLVDELQVRSAHAQRDQWGGRLAQILVEKHFVAEDAVVEALAKSLGVQRVSLGASPRDGSALAKLDAGFCKDKGVFPVALRDGGKTLLLAMADPTDLDVVDEVGRRTRTRVSTAVAGEGEIRAAVDRHYLNREPALTALPRQFKRGATLAEGAPGEEFKITDMSGSTVVGVAAAKPAPPTLAPAAPPAAAESPGDLLDDLLGGAGASAFSDEDLARIQAVAENQEKAGKILRALTELLSEKGIA